MQNTNLILQEPDVLSWLIATLGSVKFLACIAVAIWVAVILAWHRGKGKGR